MKDDSLRRIKPPSINVVSRIQYIAAKPCPICERPLHYFITDAAYGSAWRVELGCTVCGASVDAFLLPASGDTEDAREHNMHEDMQQIADVTLKVKANACRYVDDIRLKAKANQTR